MSWYDPSSWSDEAQRAALAIATGGGSELATGGNGDKALEQGKGYVNDLLGKGGKIPGAPTPAEIAAARADSIGRFDAAGNQIQDFGRTAAEDRTRALAGPGTAPLRDWQTIQRDPMTYHDVNAPTDAHAYSGGPIERVDPTMVLTQPTVSLRDPGAIERAQANGINAADVGPAALARGVDVKRAAVDTGQADETRGAAMTNIADLERAASGMGPSAAEELLKASAAKTGQKLMGAASAARGSSRNAARRAAAHQTGEAEFANAAQQAAARAAETASARNALGNVISSTRGTDVQQAAHVADLTQQADNLQGEIDRALSQGDQEAVNRLKSQQADLRQSASTFTAGAQNTASLANANAANARGMDVSRLGADIDTGNVTRATGVNIRNADAATAASGANATAANLRAQHDADLRTATERGNIDARTAVDTGNAGRETTTDVNSADEGYRVANANNVGGIGRDVSEADRVRGDFNAKETAAGAATGRIGQAAQANAQNVQAMATNDLAYLAAQGNAAAQAELARRNAQQGAAAFGGKVVGAIAGIPPTDSPLKAPDFGANNAPSVYGGNTVAF